ncbi:MAG: signal peptidase II [Treponema sp.]|jgi:signal peptidase II|nr:signal peptidase II [Treponema sp.]
MTKVKHKLLPFILTLLTLGADQSSKAFIAARWPQNSFITDVFGNEFLHIIHVRNKAIAFSLGYNLPEWVKPLLFVLVPLAVLALLIRYYFVSNEFNALQRWSVAGILGGGIGNLIDRIFRPDGVVDFISVKFYGFLGLERWPTFNVADSCVVVFGILLFVTMFRPEKAGSGDNRTPEPQERRGRKK